MTSPTGIVKLSNSPFPSIDPKRQFKSVYERAGFDVYRPGSSGGSPRNASASASTNASSNANLRSISTSQLPPGRSQLPPEFAQRRNFSDDALRNHPARPAGLTIDAKLANSTVNLGSARRAHTPQTATTTGSQSSAVSSSRVSDRASRTSAGARNRQSCAASSTHTVLSHNTVLSNQTAAHSTKSSSAYPHDNQTKSGPASDLNPSDSHPASESDYNSQGFYSANLHNQSNPDHSQHSFAPAEYDSLDIHTQYNSNKLSIFSNRSDANSFQSEVLSFVNSDDKLNHSDLEDDAQASQEEEEEEEEQKLEIQIPNFQIDEPESDDLYSKPTKGIREVSMAASSIYSERNSAIPNQLGAEHTNQLAEISPQIPQIKLHSLKEVSTYENEQAAGEGTATRNEQLPDTNQIDEISKPKDIIEDSPSIDYTPQPSLVPKKFPPGEGPCRTCHLPIEAKPIYSRNGELSGQWHRNCFKCSLCDIKFNKHTTCFVINDLPYCEYHYHLTNNSLCKICGNGIIGRCLENDIKDRYHVDCLKCFNCNNHIASDYISVDDVVYCNDCSNEKFNLNNNVLQRRRTKIYYV